MILSYLCLKIECVVRRVVMARMIEMMMIFFFVRFGDGFMWCCVVF